MACNRPRSATSTWHCCDCSMQLNPHRGETLWSPRNVVEFLSQVFGRFRNVKRSSATVFDELMIITPIGGQDRDTGNEGVDNRPWKLWGIPFTKVTAI